MYVQLIDADESLTTSTITVDTKYFDALSVIGIATTATIFTVDLSEDNVSWLNYYTSVAAELKYAPQPMLNTVKYVRISAASAGVSGTDTVSLLLSLGGLKDRSYPS